MTFWKWSRTASANATADATCPFPEGMAPSAVNDGVRGLMAAAAKYRDDVSGATVTGGTSSAYTLTTNQGFTSPIADGTGLAFWAHATNAAGATLNVDGTGAVPFMAPITLPLPAGVLVAGTPYRIRYTNLPGWVLEGMFGQVYSIPIGGFLPYLSITPPNSSFALPLGQKISRTTYATLFSMIGTTFGPGDGSSTFNIPDLRGRAIIGIDMPGGDNNQYIDRVTAGAGGNGLNSRVIGAAGGAQNVTLDVSMIPSHRHSVGLSDPGHSHTQNYGGGGGNPTNGGNVGAGPPVNNGPSTTAPSVTGIAVHDGVGNQNITGAVGSGAPYSTMQPSITLPILLRVI